jgi:hypothetical protein
VVLRETRHICWRCDIQRARRSPPGIFECPCHQRHRRVNASVPGSGAVRLPACCLDETHYDATWRERAVKLLGHVVLQVLVSIYRSATALLDYCCTPVVLSNLCWVLNTLPLLLPPVAHSSTLDLERLAVMWRREIKAKTRSICRRFNVKSF